MAAKIKGANRPKLYATLRERHGANCHWCGEPMCFDTREKPDSVTIEHLVRKVDGGTNAQSNLRLAHKRCNEGREPGFGCAVPGSRWRAPRRAHLPFHVPRHWA
jgi:hypothetical protein